MPASSVTINVRLRNGATIQPPAFACTAHYIAWYASHTPQATAVVEDALRVTYRTIAADLVRCISALEHRGLKPGMLIGVEPLRQRYLHLLLLLANEVVGTTATSLVPPDQWATDPVVAHCDALLLREMRPESDHPAVLTIPDDFLGHLAATPLPPRHVQRLEQAVVPDRIGRIFRTSGTTGIPKAIATSCDAQQRAIISHMRRVPDDVLDNVRFFCIYNFAPRPIYFRVLGVLQHGGTLLLSKEEHAPMLLGAGAVNHAAFMVGDAERIAQRGVAPPPGHNPLIELIGAGTSPRLRALLEQRFSARVRTRYSANETDIIADTDHTGLGTLSPGAAVRIVDASGHALPTGETGLIQVRTDTMADGYYNDPDLTAAAFVDGWFHTNDIGFIPGPGKLVVLGRTDSLLNIGGVKVPSAPLEAAIMGLPGIGDAAVVSIESPNGVGTLLAAIETADGQLPSEVHRQIGQILSRHVRMFEIAVLPSFPRTENGKIRRHEIAAVFHRGRPPLSPPDT